MVKCHVSGMTTAPVPHILIYEKIVAERKATKRLYCQFMAHSGKYFEEVVITAARKSIEGRFIILKVSRAAALLAFQITKSQRMDAHFLADFVN